MSVKERKTKSPNFESVYAYSKTTRKTCGFCFEYLLYQFGCKLSAKRCYALKVKDSSYFFVINSEDSCQLRELLISSTTVCNP